jgi:TolB-like protein/tetratricopeptide (TPR) repeat protein
MTKQECAMNEPSPGTPSVKSSVDRLDSWKEIAAYLKRDVTTVQRWEKREGMPVHRQLHDRMGSVYAFGSELDSWVQGRRLRLEEEEENKPRVESNAHEEIDVQLTGTSRTRLWLVASGVTLLALLTVTCFMLVGRSRHASQPKITSLAVLPLSNLSGDAAQEYLSDGMTEALIGRLSRIRDLRVTSRTTVMLFKDSKLSVPEIAGKLGVDAIVEGSVIREGSRIRVNAQLIRGHTDDHFWSETYDRDLSNALALESEVAQSIARKVEVTITGEENQRLTAVRLVSPEVYESYLKGEFAFGNGNAGFEKSLGYFEEAIRKDPTFAPAYVGVAKVYADESTVFAGGPPTEARRNTIVAAKKALELDPNLAEAHLLLAEMLQGQYRWAESDAEYRLALELEPSSAAAQNAFSHWLLCQGRTEEALAWSQRAREHDPLAVSGLDIGWILFLSRRYDQAAKELRSVLTVEPDNPVGLWYSGFVLMAKGQPEEAIPALEKALSISERRPAIIGVLIRAYAHAGRRPEALRLLEELKQRQKTNYVPAAAFVNAYLGLDDNEQAFAWLERAYQEQSNIVGFVKVHPYFDPLRGDPRFTKLVHQVGLD